MKKVLGLIASKRKLGNSEIIIKEISTKIPFEHKLNLNRLPELNIDYCKACYSCVEKSKDCVIKDDLQLVIDAIIESDALIIAAPTYFLTVHSSLIQLMDRFLTLYTYSDKIWHKPAIAVGICGIENKSGSTETMLNLFLNVLMCDIKGVEIMQGAFPGEVVANSDNTSKIQNLAIALFGEKIIDDKPRCMICGNNSFSFHSDNKIMCLVCSNIGTFKVENGRIAFDIIKDEHEIFLSENSAIEHKLWLIDMKKKFFEQKDLFREIRKRFLNVGEEVSIKSL